MPPLQRTGWERNRNPTKTARENLCGEYIPEITADETKAIPDQTLDPAPPPPPPIKKANVWELYNDKAKLYDQEMLKEWEESLSILLVFAALFSAVLTAFIISSMPLLQDDNNAAMRSILVTISMQLGNSSISPYQPVDFIPETWCIHVNCLFFASLGCNLVAALASVLALQWIRDYDIGLARVTIPRERALRRHFRFEGVHKWRMPEIIAVLPTLLHVALLLFLGGLVEWLIHIHFTVSTTMIIVLCASGIFYLVTQVCPVVYPSAPFRTPISHFIELNGTLLYIRLYLPAARLWRQYFGGWTPTRNSREGDDAATQKIVVTTPRFREQNVVHSDILLPSSALSWLLGHVERSKQSKHHVGEIMKVLATEDGLSTISTPNLKGKAEWSEIIEWYIGELWLSRQDLHYSHDAEDEFFFCSQMAVVIGEGSLPERAQVIAKSSLFQWPDYQTTRLGVSIRLALWKNRCAYSIDVANPLNLFKEICQLGLVFTTGVHIICLEEMRKFMALGELSAEDLLSWMAMLIHKPQTNLVFNDSFNSQAFRTAIYTSTIQAVNKIHPLPIPLPIPTTDVDAMTYILDVYRLREQSNPWPAEVGRLYRALFALLVSLVLPLGMTSLHTALELVPILTHPTISLIWDDSSVINAGDWIIEVTRKLPRQYKFTDPPIQLGNRLVTTTASVAFWICYPLPVSAVPGSVHWDILVKCLTMVANACCKASVTDVNIPSEIPLVTKDSFAWVYSILASLNLEMLNEDFALTASWLLARGTRGSLDQMLHCRMDADRIRKLSSLGNPILAIAGCVMMGWKYDEFIPPYDDPVWNSIAWKIMLVHFLTYPPVYRCPSEVTLFLAMSRQNSHQYDEMILDACSKRKPVINHELSKSSALAQLMQAAFPAFKNMPHVPFGRLKAIIDEWVVSPTFFNDFVAEGGLEWLATRENAFRARDFQRSDTKESLAPSPIDLLFEQSSGKHGVTTLSSENCEHLLHSSLICNFPNDFETQYNLLEHVCACYRRLQELDAKPVCKEASSTCAMILNHLIVETRCYGGEGPQRLPSRQGRFANFDDWCTEMRKCIVGLRG